MAEFTDPNTAEPEAEGLDLTQYLFLFLRNWYWLAFGLAFGYAVAWAILRYSTPIYRVSATALLNEKDQNVAFPLGSTTGLAPVNNIETDLLVLKSVNLMRRVVDSLGLHVSYFSKGRVISNETYPATGVRLRFAEPTEAAYGLELPITLLDQTGFVLQRSETDTLPCSFGTPFPFKGALVVVDSISRLRTGTQLLIRIEDPNEVAARYADALETKQSGQSNVVNLSLRDAVPQKAQDILQTLVQAFNAHSIETKNESDRKTIQFIDERLQYITQELYDVEKEVEGYKRDKQLAFGLGGRATSYPELLSSLEDEQVSDIELQLALLDDVEQTLQDALSREEQLPAGTEILGKGGLSERITAYNALLLRREEVRSNAKAGNPAVKTFDQQLAEAREAILLGIRSQRRELTLRRSTIERRLGPIEREIGTIPTIERELLQIMRQQQIKEQLFLLLLQRREEAALSVAAKVAASRILNAPKNDGRVSPNRWRILLACLALGLGIPGGILFLQEYLDQRIYTEKHIRKGTHAPFLGTIGLAKGEHPIVVKKGSRSYVAEMFRLLRTNLQFMAAGSRTQVYLVTSSFSEEGKSFVTINLGLSLSLSGQRTLLLGLDMRKPRLSRYLTGHFAQSGVSNFMVDENARLEDLIRPVPGYEHVDYLDCGPIPPNPAELIGSKRTYALFEYLRQHYDVILVDTSPIGLVSDAFLLHPHVEQTLLVTRFGVTHRHFLNLAEDTYQHKKLPKLGILLNGVKADRRYGHGYGYGYGNGYGYGYYEEDQQHKPWYKRIPFRQKKSRKKRRGKW